MGFREISLKITEQISQVRIITHSTPPVKQRDPSYWGKKVFIYRKGRKNQTESHLAFVILGNLKNAAQTHCTQRSNL